MNIMRLIRKKVSKNEQGAALLTIMCVFCVVSILMLATLSFVAQAHYQTTKNYYNRQAYYTARSGLDTVIDYLSAPENQPNAINIKNMIPLYGTNGELVAETIDMESVGMGKYTITMKYEAGGTIVITSDAVYGEGSDMETHQSLSAYLVKDAGGFDGLFDSAIKSNSTANAFSTQAKVFGNLTLKAEDTDMRNNPEVMGGAYVVGDMNMITATLVDVTEKSLVIDGNMNVSDGNLTVTTKNKQIEGDRTTNSSDMVDVRGKIYISSGVAAKFGSAPDAEGNRYDVDVYCSQLEIYKSAEIYGNLYVHPDKDGKFGDVKLGGTLTVHGDVFIYGQLDMTAGSNAGLVVDGNLYINGKSDAVLTSGGKAFVYGDFNNSISVGESIFVYNYDIYKTANNGMKISRAQNIVIAGDFIGTKTHDHTVGAVYAAGDVTTAIQNIGAGNINYNLGVAVFNYMERTFPEFNEGSAREDIPVLRDPGEVFSYANMMLAETVIMNMAPDIDFARHSTVRAGDDGFKEVESVNGTNFYVTSTSFNLDKAISGGHRNILIKPTTTDVVVYLNGASYNNGGTILVDNSENAGDYLVYFVLGDYRSSSSENDPDNWYIKDSSSDAVPFVINPDTPSFNASFDNAIIMDKDTYLAFVDNSKYLDFSNSDSPESNWYKPEKSTIYFICMQGSTMNFNNQCTIEGAILAPNATVKYVNGKTANVVGPDMIERNNTNIFHIGSGIYGSVSAQNNPIFAFVEPASCPWLNSSEANIMGEAFNVIYKKN